MLQCAIFRSPIMIFLRFNGLLFPLSPFYRYFYVVLGGSFLAYLCIMTAPEAAPSYGSQYVQLYATDRGYDCSNRDGYRKFRLGERDRYRTCIPRSIYCDSK